MISAYLDVIVLEFSLFVEFLFFPIAFPETRSLFWASPQKNLGNLITDETDRFVF
jgi:hypothetical protein